MLVMFEQNRMVRTIQNFDKVLTPFRKMFLCLKQLFDAKL